jgi:hypothetical protein
MDWIRSLPEYSKLLRDDSTLGEFYVVDNATNGVASTADDNHDQVLVTTQPTRAFKLVNIAGCELHVLCALDIPVGTRYIPQGDITMYERATIAGLYGYPRVRIDEHVRENKLNIVSMYDKNFHYAIAGEIVREVVAMSDGVPAALKIGSGVGIYTYATMISAWNHVSLSFAYIAPE